MQRGKPREFGAWIIKPEMVRLQQLSLGINSLRKRGDEITRRSAPKPDGSKESYFAVVTQEGARPSLVLGYYLVVLPGLIPNLAS